MRLCESGREFLAKTLNLTGVSSQVNVLFVVDEISDEQSGKDARNTCFSFVDAMRNPDSHDESVVARITKE